MAARWTHSKSRLLRLRKRDATERLGTTKPDKFLTIHSEEEVRHALNAALEKDICVIKVTRT